MTMTFPDWHWALVGPGMAVARVLSANAGPYTAVRIFDVQHRSDAVDCTPSYSEVLR